MRRQKPTRHTPPNARHRLHRMRRYRRRGQFAALSLLIVATAGPFAGCTTSKWRPPMQGVEQAPTALRVDLRSRQPQPNTRYIYKRISHSNPDVPPQSYPVVHLPNGTREGAFAETGIASLTPYFANDSSEDRTLDGSLWPQPWINGTAGLLLRFDEPFVHLPDMLDANNRWRQKANVDVHDPKGRKLFTATATRDITLEGYETATLGDRTFPDCVRLCAETRIHLPWIARVDIDEYLWLAPGKGCVRRIQAIRGSVFFRHIEDVVEDQFESEEPIRAADHSRSALAVHDLGTWQRAAFFFNPSWPKPHLAGMIVDYAPGPGWVVELGCR